MLFKGHKYAIFKLIFIGSFLSSCVQSLSEESALAFYATYSLSGATDSNSSSSSDTKAPTISNSTLGIDSIGKTEIQFSWESSTDETTSADNLNYQLYYSLTDNIQTAEDAVKNGTLITSYNGGATTKTLEGVSSATQYYINVIVQDEAGNKAAYTSKSVATVVADNLKLFIGGTSNGDLGGRNGVDTLCLSTLQTSYSSLLSCKHARGFVSISDDDEVRDMPGNYFIPTDLPVYGVSPSTASNPSYVNANWSYLLDAGNYPNSISPNVFLDMGGLPLNYWTGSYGNGTVNTNLNCDGFSATSNTGYMGNYSSQYNDWLGFVSTSCSNSYYFLCVCY